MVDWLEFNVPFQHKYGYIRDEEAKSEKDLRRSSLLTVCQSRLELSEDKETRLE